MKAAFIEKTGPADQLLVGELPTPTPSPGEVLIEVVCASVNPIDVYIRGGMVPMELPYPFIPGSDFAGCVVATGEGVSDFKPGDRVWGSNQGLLGRQGTLAEFITVRSEFIYRIPENVSYERAAASALVGITAAIGLRHKAQLKPGEKVLVSGASGAIGSMVIQMAKAMGGDVTATTSSIEKSEHCLLCGAQKVVHYTDPHFIRELLDHSNEGYDVFWETSRDPDLESAIGLLKENGRMILMAGRDARPEFPVGPFYVKGCSLLGFAMFKMPPELQNQCADEINGWMASEEINPLISHKFELSDAAEAHRTQEEVTLNHSPIPHGKILVHVSDRE